MKSIPYQIQILRSLFLKSTRAFLETSGFWEVDTPIFKPIVGMEPYLDPFLVHSPNKEEKGYLITSPEYSLKQSLATGLERIYEITHTFRSGEKGSPYHSKEFLMLELYAKGWNDGDLRKFIKTYFQNLGETFSKSKLDTSANAIKIAEKLLQDGFYREVSVEESFLQNTGRGYGKEDLLLTISESKLTNTPPSELNLWQYEDLFFLVFLNLVEPKLGEEIVFLYDYPPECAALARIESGKAKRFEIYWDGIELANAFWELTDASEQRKRFVEEQKLREKLGKEVFSIDEDFLSVLESGMFPGSSGISLGLDRILMKLAGAEGLKQISPYYEF
ncbi:amino acid--tRNA ligase-related protein [Leptospira idonii]|uniref:Elongation factor P--(R)-beta-lysine ligase n=1 Tax=Leptospira idonii TaxID=1193500 RepID=A0A4R9M1I8_9LEPT|nr:amino acid--tRNA ligase-related protein [Leptospira idonii]TGN19119.1 elongation factor P--(R)-beta-lysine ligase [Leptospira idonii]